MTRSSAVAVEVDGPEGIFLSSTIQERRRVLAKAAADYKSLNLKELCIYWHFALAQHGGRQDEASKRWVLQATNALKRLTVVYNGCRAQSQQPAALASAPEV